MWIHAREYAFILFNEYTSGPSIYTCIYDNIQLGVYPYTIVLVFIYRVYVLPSVFCQEKNCYVCVQLFDSISAYTH